MTHRFGSKSRLLAYVHDTVMADWISRVQQAVGNRSGTAALARVVDALYSFLVEAPQEMRAMYLLRYASIDPSADFRNALSPVLYTALAQVLTELQDDFSVRALVLTGGRHFCVGGDLAALDDPPLAMRAAMQVGHRIVRARCWPGKLILNHYLCRQRILPRASGRSLNVEHRIFQDVRNARST